MEIRPFSAGQIRDLNGPVGAVGTNGGVTLNSIRVQGFRGMRNSSKEVHFTDQKSEPKN